MNLDQTLTVIFGIASLVVLIITAILLRQRYSIEDPGRDLEKRAHPALHEYIMMGEIHSVHRWHTQ